MATNKNIIVGVLGVLLIILMILWNFQRNYYNFGNSGPTMDKGTFLYNNRDNQSEINRILYSDASHVMMYKKPDYLPGYKNPCFVVEKYEDGYHPVIGSEEWQSAMFNFTACFPSIILVGFRKCGTTDMSKMLHHHKGVQRGKKEYRFFGLDKPSSFQKDSYTVLDYITLLKSPVLQKDKMKYHGVERSLVDDSVSPDYGKTLLLGDYSPGYTCVFCNWKLDPFNKGLQLPKFVLPHWIHHLVPHAKILFMLRNPAERNWSNFRYKLRYPKICELFNCHNETSLAMKFHHGMKTAISHWHLCELFYKGDGRMCLYHFSDYEFLSKSEEMQFKQIDKIFMNLLSTSLYYIPLLEYYKVFPKKNILIVDLEKYTENRWRFMNDVVLPLLDLAPFTQNETNSVNLGISNKSKIRMTMLPETRDMLQQFYAHDQRKVTALRQLKN